MIRLRQVIHGWHHLLPPVIIDLPVAANQAVATGFLSLSLPSAVVGSPNPLLHLQPGLLASFCGNSGEHSCIRVHVWAHGRHLLLRLEALHHTSDAILQLRYLVARHYLSSCFLLLLRCASKSFELYCCANSFTMNR